VVAEGGAGGRDGVGVFGAVEWRLGLSLRLLGNDVVDRLLHGSSAIKLIGSANQGITYQPSRVYRWELKQEMKLQF
jgi:hypothetical protein